MKSLGNKLYRYIHQLGLRKKYYRSDKEIMKTISRHRLQGTSTALDLGSGPHPKNPFAASVIHGVDIRSNLENNVAYGDLSSGKLPYADNLFDFVTAYDVLEHVPRVMLQDGETKFPLILLMNEVFRVLKPGGIFFNIQPCYPFKEAFQDPTHVNVMTEDTMYLYFCEPAWARIYGYDGSFSMIDDGWFKPKYYSFLKKIHDKPIKNLDFVQK